MNYAAVLHQNKLLRKENEQLKSQLKEYIDKAINQVNQIPPPRAQIKKYHCIFANGKEEIRNKMSLEEMQKIVDGYVESVSRPYGIVYCNEDGLRLDLPINKKYGEFCGNIIIEEVM